MLLQLGNVPPNMVGKRDDVVVDLSVEYCCICGFAHKLKPLMTGSFMPHLHFVTRRTRMHYYMTIRHNDLHPMTQEVFKKDRLRILYENTICAHHLKSRYLDILEAYYKAVRGGNPHVTARMNAGGILVLSKEELAEFRFDGDFDHWIRRHKRLVYSSFLAMWPSNWLQAFKESTGSSPAPARTEKVGKTGSQGGNDGEKAKSSRHV